MVKTQKYPLKPRNQATYVCGILGAIGSIFGLIIIPFQKEIPEDTVGYRYFVLSMILLLTIGFILQSRDNKIMKYLSIFLNIVVISCLITIIVFVSSNSLFDDLSEFIAITSVISIILVLINLILLIFNKNGYLSFIFITLPLMLVFGFYGFFTLYTPLW